MCKDFDETQTDLWEALRKIENDGSNYAFSFDIKDSEILMANRLDLKKDANIWTKAGHLGVYVEKIIFNVRDTHLQ